MNTERLKELLKHVDYIQRVEAIMERDDTIKHTVSYGAWLRVALPESGATITAIVNELNNLCAIWSIIVKGAEICFVFELDEENK